MSIAILFIVLDFITKVVTSWLPNANEHKKLKKILEQIVRSHIAGKDITPEAAVSSILEFYEKNKLIANLESPDDDMLLFQYGTYDWDGNGARS